MPENLSTIDTPSDELDLNSDDALLSEKKNEVQRVTTTTESSVTIGVSVATKILPEGGKTDEVRVSTSGVNLVGTSTQSSDALVEGDSNQELVPFDVSELQNQDEARQTVIEVVNVECTTITTESEVIDGIQVVGREVGVMDDMEVSGTDALDRSLEAEEAMVGRVEDFLSGDSSHKNEHEETAAQLAGTVSDQVFFHERMDSQTVEENRNDGACVTVDSSLVAQVSEGSQQGKDENPNSEVQVSEYHASEKEEGECSRETNELPVEQLTDFDGGELGEMDSGEVMETNGEVSGIDALDETEENEWLEAEAFDGSAGSHPNGDHRLNENNSIRDTKQEMVNQITENDADQVDGARRMDLHPGEENQDIGVTVDSSLRAEVSDVCQAKAACSSSLQSGDNPDSARLTASIKPFVDENLGLEVQVTEGCSSEDKEKAGIQFVEAECSILLNKSLVEHNEQIKVVAVKNVVSVAEVLHENPLVVEKDKSLEAEAVGGSAASFATGNLGHEENTSKQADRHETVVQLAKTTIDSSSLSKIPDGSQGAGAFYFPKEKSNPDSAYITEFVESLSDTNPDSAVQVIESHALETTQVAETVSNQVDRDEKSSPPSGKNPNEGDYVKVDSSSLANNVTDESQGIACASLHIESFQSLVDRNLDTGVQGTDGHALEDEELKTGVDVVKLGVSTMITEALVEQVQVVGGETTVMEKNEVAEAECITSGSDALDGNSICAEEYQSLQAEAMGGSSKSSSSCDVITSLQDEKQEMTAQVAEMVSVQTDGDDRMNSHPDEENPHGDAYVTVGSNSVAKVSDGSETTGACVQIADSSGLLDGNLDSELEVTEDHDIEDEEQKSGVETVKAGGSMKNNEALVEQIQVVGGQVTALDNEETFKTKDNVSGTEILDGNPTCQEKTQSFEAEAIYWNTESHPSVNPSHEENTSMLDGKQGMVSQLTEMNSKQVHRDELSNSYSVQDCMNIEGCPSAYSSLAVEVIDGSQSTGISASLEANLDSDIRNHMALLHEDQNMASHAFEINASPRQLSHTPDAEIATESAGGFSNLDGSQITKSNVLQAPISELNTNECIMDSLVKDFCISSGTEGNQNARGEVVNETVSTGDLICRNGDEHEKMEGDVDLSVLDPLEDDAAVVAREVSLDGNQGFEQPKDMEEQAVTSVSLQSKTALERESVVSYYLTPEMEGDFSVSDLVWGKVRSHPWWPGQIFDSSDSSEQAMKYHKNDNYLVAYFGDQTFAWNEASSMKHFRTHFSQMQKQASSEAFRVAVDGALDEVSRRVELGMTCSCTPEEIYSKVESQVIDNAGIREGARRRDGVDESLSVSSFQPDNFVQYIKGLALHPRGESDRVELVIAQAQLTALYRLKGYFGLPEFHVFKGLSESGVASSLSGARKHSEEVVENAIPFSENEEHASSAEVQLESQEMVEHAIPVSGNEEQASSVEVQLENSESSSRKRKHISEDSSNSSKKERNRSELLIGENLSSFHDNDGNDHGDEKAVIDSASLSSGKEPEVDESILDDLKNRKQRLSPSRDTDAEPPTPQSFKVGDCIRRIASQLTGAPPILMSRGERFQESAGKVDGVDCSPQTYEGSHGRRVVIPKEFSYPDEMLSQLCLAARDPMKGYSFLAIIVDFFSEFRNSIVLDCKSEKMGIGNTVAKKSSNTKISSVETFDFEDTNDSYWTDRIVQLQGNSDEQPPHKTCKENTQTDKDSTSIKPGSDSDNKSSRKNRKRKGESGTWVDDPTGNDNQLGNSLQVGPSLDSKQQNIDGNKDLSMKKPAPKPRRRKVACIQTPAEKNIPFVDRLNPKLPYHWQNLDVNNEMNNAPTALILSFTEIRSIPSEVNLNKIFGRFGPLKFSETEVSEETNSARVVFKRRNDAEVALSSATAFSIFGPASVSYQLMYWSPTPSKASPFASTVGGQDVTFKEGNTT